MSGNRNDQKHVAHQHTHTTHNPKCNYAICETQSLNLNDINKYERRDSHDDDNQLLPGQLFVSKSIQK